ncbi:hypothetical protein NL676_039502 [Syzygium grande]|nr:hypothetical protein NL676_039502 [Syzygium grande]
MRVGTSPPLSALLSSPPLGSALPVQSLDSLSVSLRLPLYSFVVNLCRLLPLQRKQRPAVGRAAQRARLGLVPVLVVVADGRQRPEACRDSSRCSLVMNSSEEEAAVSSRAGATLAEPGCALLDSERISVADVRR